MSKKEQQIQITKLAKSFIVCLFIFAKHTHTHTQFTSLPCQNDETREKAEGRRSKMEKNGRTIKYILTVLVGI